MRWKKIIAGCLIMIAIVAVFYNGLQYVIRVRNEKKIQDLKAHVSTELMEKQKDKSKRESPESEELEYVEIPIDFETLKEENSDIYAWIDIPGMTISYPVLQYDNVADLRDDYYLNHNLDGSKGYPGVIYTEQINAKDFSDVNTVLYGHNLKDKTMFSHLLDYKDINVLESNSEIDIYTEEYMYIYQIYGAFLYSDSHLILNYDYTSDEGIKNFILDMETGEGNYLEQNKIDDVKSCHLLTLSTCTNYKPDERYIVLAKLVDKKRNILKK